jgi:class 3 adenylate cyclase
MIVCAACGHENVQEARFCNGCGQSLVRASEAREERKVVTVVFADLVGSTARAESLDPEDVRALLSTYHVRVRHELEGHGGTVEKFIGDAVVAIFSAALRDDLAGGGPLAIQDAIGELNEVEPRSSSSADRGEHRRGAGAPRRGRKRRGMVSGDVINTAARRSRPRLPAGAGRRADLSRDDTCDRLWTRARAG